MKGFFNPKRFYSPKGFCITKEFCILKKFYIAKGFCIAEEFVKKEHNGLGLQLQKFASFTGLKINHDHNWWVIIGTLGGNYDDIKLGLGPKLGWVYY